MTNNARVLNITRGFTLKHKQALRAIDECACAWATNEECDSANVPRGTAVRDLTLSESIQARSIQAKHREPMPLAEIHGLTFDLPKGNGTSARMRFGLVSEANRFAATVNTSELRESYRVGEMQPCKPFYAAQAV